MAYEHLDRLDEARDAYKQAVAAAADESGGAVAKGNLGRLAGVKSIHPMQTAKIDTPKPGTTNDTTNDPTTTTTDDSVGHVDGGVK